MGNLLKKNIGINNLNYINMKYSEYSEEKKRKITVAAIGVTAIMFFFIGVIVGKGKFKFNELK